MNSTRKISAPPAYVHDNYDDCSPPPFFLKLKFPALSCWKMLFYCSILVWMTGCSLLGEHKYHHPLAHRNRNGWAITPKLERLSTRNGGKISRIPISTNWWKKPSLAISRCALQRPALRRQKPFWVVRELAGGRP